MLPAGSQASGTSSQDAPIQRSLIWRSVSTSAAFVATSTAQPAPGSIAPVLHPGTSPSFYLSRHIRPPSPFNKTRMIRLRLKRQGVSTSFDAPQPSPGLLRRKRLLAHTRGAPRWDQCFLVWFGGDISFFQMLWAFRPSSKEPLSLSLLGRYDSLKSRHFFVI